VGVEGIIGFLQTVAAGIRQLVRRLLGRREPPPAV